MSGTHFISQTVFDIHSSSREGNNDLQDKISALFHSRISHEINELFSEYAYTGETIRISELAVDTGRLRLSELDHELPGRIIDALRKELDKLKIRSVNEPSPDGYNVIPANDHLLQAFGYFLNTGSFRWRDTPYETDDLLEQLIRKDPAQLVKLLKKAGKKKHVRERLVYRLKETKLNTLIQLLEPSYGALILEYIKENDSLHEHRQVVQTEGKEFRKANYLFVLTYLFTERGSVFNTRNFVRSLIRQMAAHYNLAYTSLLLQLVQSLPLRSGVQKSNNLFYFIRELFLEDTVADSAAHFPIFKDPVDLRSLSPEKQKEAQDQYLYYYLEKGYPPAGLASLSRERLRELLLDAADHRFSAFQYFIQRISKKRAAENIAEILQETNDTKFIHRFLPPYSNWIGELSKALSGAGLHDLFSPPLHTDRMKRAIRSSVLQTTFAFMHVSFSKNTFLSKVVRFISLRSGTDSSLFKTQVKERLERLGHTEYSGLIGEKTIKKETTQTTSVPVKREPFSGPDSRNREMNALKYFLVHGKSPWWYTAADVNAFKKLLETHFYTTSGTHMLFFLRRHITESKFREHLLSLSGDAIQLRKKLYRKTTESQIAESAWPVMKNKLNYSSYKAVKEAYLVYALLRTHKKKEVLWYELEKIFSSYAVDLLQLFEELVPLNSSVPGLSSDQFFSFLHLHFTEKITFHHETAVNSAYEKKGTSQTENQQEKDRTSENGGKLEQLLQYLHTGTIDPPKQQEVNTLILEGTKELQDQKNSQDTRLLFLTLKNETSVNRLIAGLNDSELEKVLRTIFPQPYGLLKNYLDDLSRLFRYDTIRNKFPVSYRLLIRYTLFFLAEHHKKNFRVADYLAFLMKQLFPLQSNYFVFIELLKTAVSGRKLQLKTHIASTLLLTAREEKKKEEEKEDTEEQDDLIFIENAGLILLSPFFSFYFQTLGLTENNAFVSERSAARAACLLEYLVTGSEQITEQTLSLNKALCNVPRHYPIEDLNGLTEQEKELSDQLLHTVIARWEILKNTSIEGLRNSFLKRAGKLEWTDEKISLQVEAKGYDMLLDRIPWNISVIKLPWMEKTIYAKWR